jgi:hypothetical protein
MSKFGFRVLLTGLIAAGVHTACRKTDETVRINDTTEKKARFLQINNPAIRWCRPLHSLPGGRMINIIMWSN